MSRRAIPNFYYLLCYSSGRTAAHLLPLELLVHPANLIAKPDLCFPSARIGSRTWMDPVL
jgi:hypothetical protein